MTALMARTLLEEYDEDDEDDGSERDDSGPPMTGKLLELLNITNPVDLEPVLGPSISFRLHISHPVRRI